MSNVLKKMFKLDSRPSFTIEKDGEPYLTRWWMSSKTEERYHSRKHVPSLLLHRIWRQDADRFCHSHPWWFVSLVLKGRYVENRYNNDGIFIGQIRRRRFSVALRKATDYHTIAEVSDDLWTLVLVGPKRHEWGFMTNAGWVHWEDYIDGGDEVRTSAP